MNVGRASDLNRILAKEALTPAEAGLMCRVPASTIRSWVSRKKDRLPSYRVHEAWSGVRIEREALIAFMREHGMPLLHLEDPACPRILCVCASDHISEFFSRYGAFSVRNVGHFREAVEAFCLWLPPVVVIDYDFCPNADLLCGAFKTFPTKPLVIGIGMDPSIPRRCPCHFFRNFDLSLQPYFLVNATNDFLRGRYGR